MIEDWKKECGKLELKTHPISGEIGYGRGPISGEIGYEDGKDSHKKHKSTQKGLELNVIRLRANANE